jgi:cholest-4-en-3-one 26-monooxygenase
METSTETQTPIASPFGNVWHGEWTKNPKIVDLNDSTAFLRGFPHAAMDRVRHEHPVYWNEEAPEWGPGFWNLTRYDDIVAASRDTETFSSAKGVNISYGPNANEEIVTAVVGNMICMDPPLHRVYRKIAKPFFTSTSIASLESRIRELVTGIVDRALEKKDCDFMVDVAAPLPISVLCDILGVPQSDWRLIFDWSNILIGFEDPEFGVSRERVEGTFLSLFGYGQQLIAERRAHPRKDLMTAIAMAEPEDGVPIPEHLLNGFFLLMVIAGNETTRNSLSGGMHALIENPAEKRKLDAERALLPTAVEEILRWVSPVNHMRRTATRDTEIRGVEIAAGDKVVLWYPAANRDPDAFARPQTFDVTRDPNAHLAFGIGEHFCLGAQLARLQLRVMFEELLARTRKIDPTGPVSYMRTNFINGIKAMPVRIQAA